jgi:hypothetical protein
VSTQLHAERLTCTPPTHLLATNNPWDGLTYCVCGKETLNNRQNSHTTWHERFVYEHGGRGAKVIGYEHYRLEICLCHEDGTVQEVAS